MKETTRLVVELEPAEDEAFDLVIDTLARIGYLFQSNDTKEIFLELPSGEKTVILDGMEQKAISALEEILGIWD